MLTDIVKSPMQLKYELDKINIELVSLLKNGKKKKNDFLARLVAYRAELKEFKAVLAATEEGHKVYLELVQPILNLTCPTENNARIKSDSSQEGLSKQIIREADYLRQITNLVKAAQEKETVRVNQARGVYKTNSEHVLRKTKEIYAAMEIEKNQINAYAEILTQKSKATEAQLEVQLKTNGMGIGL